ncbi:nucleotide-binding universal stress UspA family protein [Pelomonas saccharophila]|uniref:Nucleotide-binding universal stress UspA family protein n=1 Tax=Roseateles saccharophilus TaxID=304 RepID=A0ABU1YN30_ROSSA|nr:universal stress protein [Roseateles saccharophilus]MDR7270239.1 nucleotide-binding universal stress UspA family protein [Roseateles saccharophilus]
MYKHILVPVDGSPTADKGLTEAIAMARLAGSRLRLIHVVNEQSIVIGAEGFPDTTAEVIALMREAGEAILAAARQRVEDAGLPVDVLMREVFGSRIGDSVLDEAAHWPADLIVIGTHGRRGLRRLVLGSDAEHILRSAAVPVLLVRGD